MADYRRNILLGVLMNEIDSSLCTGQEFTAYANYENDERDAENTEVLAASTAVAKTVYGQLISVQSFYEETVPLYSVTAFKSHFRMHRSTVQVQTV